MTRVEVTITVDDRIMRYEADVDDLEIVEALTGEISIRPNPDLHPRPKTAHAWGGPLVPEKTATPWRKCLVGDNWLHQL